MDVEEHVRKLEEIQGGLAFLMEQTKHLLEEATRPKTKIGARKYLVLVEQDGRLSLENHSGKPLALSDLADVLGWIHELLEERRPREHEEEEVAGKVLWWDDVKKHWVGMEGGSLGFGDVWMPAPPDYEAVPS